MNLSHLKNYINTLRVLLLKRKVKMVQEFKIGDMVEVIKSVQLADGTVESAVIGSTAMIVDIVDADNIFYDREREGSAFYLLSFEKFHPEGITGLSPLWFEEGDFIAIPNKCRATHNTTPKFKLRDILIIRDGTFSGGEKDISQVGKVGIIAAIDIEAVCIGKDGELVACPYKVYLPLGALYNSWWYPEQSLELLKGRDEFKSYDEYMGYLLERAAQK
jgi:hypothetical protein